MVSRVCVTTTVLFAIGCPCWAQSSSRPKYDGRREKTSQVSNSDEQQQKAESFDAKFWKYLVAAKYRNWAPVPGKSDGMYEGQSPHGAFLRMYLNRTAAGRPQQPRNGSIIIKENYSPDKKLAAITVMYKSKGYNPTGHDWYWVKYNPNGTVAEKQTATGSLRLSGRVQGCIDCHGDAEGDDFAFFND